MNNAEVKVAVAGRHSMTRYSRADLAEFHNILLEKIRKCEIGLEDVRDCVKNNSGNGTDDTSPTFKVLEEGNRTGSKESNSKLVEILARKLVSLKVALLRIQDETYGQCHCPLCEGKLIDPNRLRAVPQATNCFESEKFIQKRL